MFGLRDITDAETIFDETFVARNFFTTPESILDLKGNVYDYYMDVISSNSGAGSQLVIDPNGDASGTTKRNYGMHGSNTTANANASDSFPYIWIFAGGPTATTGFARLKITGTQGEERLFKNFNSRGNTNPQVDLYSQYWKNVADELTSFVIKNNASETLDCRIIVKRVLKNSSTSGWEFVKKETVSAQNINTAPISFPGLSGNTAKVFQLRWKLTTGTTLSELAFRLNGVATNVYKIQRALNNGGSLSGVNTTENAGSLFDSTFGGAQEGTVTIYAESGRERVCVCSSSNSALLGASLQSEETIWFDNIPDEITSIEIIDRLTGKTATGTVELFKRDNPASTGDDLDFETIRSLDINGDFSAGVTWSGLNFDKVLLAKIEFVGEGNGFEFRMQPNGDTSSINDKQYLRTVSGAIQAASLANQPHILLADALIDGYCTTYMYPKSGEDRPTLDEWSRSGNVTYKQGSVYKNVPDEITSLKVFSANAATMVGTLKLSILRN